MKEKKTEGGFKIPIENQKLWDSKQKKTNFEKYSQEMVLISQSEYEALKNEPNKEKTIKFETVCILLLLMLVVGVATGYGWRMAQVQSTERIIVKALTSCKQLITEELVITPNLGCEEMNTAIIGLRKRTWGEKTKNELQGFALPYNRNKEKNE